MKKKYLALGALLAVIAISAIAFVAYQSEARAPMPVAAMAGEFPNVYFIRWSDDIDVSDAIIRLFNQLNPPNLRGQYVAVNVHGGEAMYVDGEWLASGLFLPYTVIGGFLTYIDEIAGGTDAALENRRMAVVETDVAYGASFFGMTTPTIRYQETHPALLQRHFPYWRTRVLDNHDGTAGEGHIEVELPIGLTRRVRTALIAEGLADFEFIINLSHFTGHSMSGFGGAIKNMGLGLSSIQGKMLAHSGGVFRSSWGAMPTEPFQQALSEVALGVYNMMEGRILHITVLNNLSSACDCWSGIRAEDGQPAPDIACIGIIASWDPVALDQAAMDLIFDANRTQPRLSAHPSEALLGVSGVPSQPTGEVATALGAAGVNVEGAGSSLLAHFVATQGQRKLDWGQHIGLGSTIYTLVEL